MLVEVNLLRVEVLFEGTVNWRGAESFPDGFSDGGFVVAEQTVERLGKFPIGLFVGGGAKEVGNGFLERSFVRGRKRFGDRRRRVNRESWQIQRGIGRFGRVEGVQGAEDQCQKRQMANG